MKNVLGSGFQFFKAESFMKINLDLPTRSQRTKKQINFNSKHKREQTALHTNGATTLSVVLLRKSASLLTFFRDWKKVSARAAWAQGKDIEEANPKKYKLTIKQLN